MRAGLSLESRTPPCWSLADLGGPYDHAKPTQSYSLVVVVVLDFVVVPVLTFDVVLGEDRGLSY